MYRMRVIEICNNYVYGMWKDSLGDENKVRFKNIWGEHVFSEVEQENLLEGKSIIFIYKMGYITGHLQYCKTEAGVKYLGFCPDFNKNYDTKPVFDPNVHSNYEVDKKSEVLMNQFMRNYYYSRLVNADGTEVKKQFIEDEKRQKQGIDVIYLKNGIRYIVDEKAQMDYIYREEGPLPTFALELLNSSSGNIGWFINDELETEYYMFIWPHADRKLLTVESIEYAYYALVERNKLKKKVEEKYFVEGRLREYAEKISKGSLSGTYENNNKVYYKKWPFDDDTYLVYTKEPIGRLAGKKERPVNLVVKKSIIEEVAEDKGILRRKEEL